MFHGDSELKALKSAGKDIPMYPSPAAAMPTLDNIMQRTASAHADVLENLVMIDLHTLPPFFHGLPLLNLSAHYKVNKTEKCPVISETKIINS